MAVLIFSGQFAGLVRAGAKRQTIRPQRARPIKVGDQLSLREWSGKPYHSPQRVLREAVCLQACPITITATSLKLGTTAEIHTADALNDFARCDGFANWARLYEYFCADHGTRVFVGDFVRW